MDATVSIGVPTEPMSPVPEDRFEVVPVMVKAPVWAILPEPLACTFATAPPPTLALRLIDPLLLVAKVMVPLVMVTAPETTNPVPPVMETVVFPPETVPVLALPKALTVRVFVPRVMV